jgi:rubrerythrin
MIETAKEEGNTVAERTFNFANEVEKIHANLYQKALENMGGLSETDYYVCSVCGHTLEGEPTDKCPVCGALPKAYFKAA